MGRQSCCRRGRIFLRRPEPELCLVVNFVARRLAQRTRDGCDGVQPTSFYYYGNFFP
jgi:hypothetical protein